MNRQQLTRRMILGVAVVMVASASLGTAHSVSAADAKKIPDHGSKANFKLNCEDIEGTFSEDGIGNTNCHYPTGSWTQCDENGKDCWYTPPPKSTQPTDPWDSHTGAGGEATADVGGTHAPAPVVVGPTAPIAQPSVTAPAGDQDQDTNTGQKKKKGKKGKKGGKGRR
jgi:hypothetical protein